MLGRSESGGGVVRAGDGQASRRRNNISIAFACSYSVAALTPSVVPIVIIIIIGDCVDIRL